MFRAVEAVGVVTSYIFLICFFFHPPSPLSFRLIAGSWKEKEERERAKKKKKKNRGRKRERKKNTGNKKEKQNFYAFHLGQQHQQSKSMDPTRSPLSFLFFAFVSVSVVSATGVFKVHHKCAGRERSLSDFKAHDARRHGRILGVVDIPMGGIGLPSEAGCVPLCNSNFSESLINRFTVIPSLSNLVDLLNYSI